MLALAKLQLNLPFNDQCMEFHVKMKKWQRPSETLMNTSKDVQKRGNRQQ